MKDEVMLALTAGFAQCEDRQYSLKKEKKNELAIAGCQVLLLSYFFPTF